MSKKLESLQKKTAAVAAIGQGPDTEMPSFFVYQLGEAATASASMREAAVAYGGMGIPVFPCGPDKKPLIPRGFKGATTDGTKIRRWWRRWPVAMIGMPTGEKSGISVLDLDDDDDPITGEVIKNGSAELKTLLEQEGLELPETYEVLTPRGGRHLYFDHQEGFKCSAGKLAKGVDTRGDGGYVILPPSRRADGKAYKVLNSERLSAIAPAPSWLVEASRSGTLAAREDKKTVQKLVADTPDDFHA